MAQALESYVSSQVDENSSCYLEGFVKIKRDNACKMCRAPPRYIVTAPRDYQTVMTYIIDNDYHYYTKNEEENGTDAHKERGVITNKQ